MPKSYRSLCRLSTWSEETPFETQIKQNAATISRNGATIGRHTRLLAKLEADALEGRAAANENQASAIDYAF